MTCCKNIKLSLKTNAAFKKAFKFQWKNAHSTVLQNAWSQKKPILSLKNKISYQKNNDFLWKTILDDKKNLGRHWKSIRSFQKIKESFENAMKCCKNTKLSLKTHFACKKAYKLQWKNAHSTVLQNAWSQKTNTFNENSFKHQKPLVFIQTRS